MKILSLTLLVYFYALFLFYFPLLNSVESLFRHLLAYIDRTFQAPLR